MNKGTNSRLMTIVRGLPGSGKSSLSNTIYHKHVSKTEYCVVLSTDDIVSANKFYLWSPETVKISHELNRLKCKEACKKGVNIIIDNTNTTWKEIRPYVDLACENDYSVNVVEPKNKWSKDVNGCFDRTIHSVPLEVIKRMADRWQATWSINAQIQKIFKEQT